MPFARRAVVQALHYLITPCLFDHTLQRIGHLCRKRERLPVKHFILSEKVFYENKNQVKRTLSKSWSGEGTGRGSVRDQQGSGR